MFASTDRTTGKKKFQKPNILRKKTRLLKSNTGETNECTNVTVKPLVSPVSVKNTPVLRLGSIISLEDSEPYQLYSTPPVKLNAENHDFIHSTSNHETNIKTNLATDISIFDSTSDTSYNENFCDLSTLNVESFLNRSENESTIILQDDGPVLLKSTENKSNPKYWLDCTRDPEEVVIQTCEVTSESNLAPINIIETISTQQNNVGSKLIPATNLGLDCLATKAVNYKCDVPNCNKSFFSEQKLQKHKNIHNKQKTSAQTPVECPVKKTNEEDVEERCPRIFPTKDELTKHLNDDHTLDDASFCCARCGRRFFWAAGLRSHSQWACERALVCAWPGCGRVFRQPCRLREHARAHTGDRPYPCLHPNCNWAFRSKSKLMRHARRHTGERRHACGACGRAFRRREHLRDHAARCHQPRQPHACHQPGCEQQFTNMSSLYSHMKKVHNKDKPRAARRKNVEFVVSLVEPTAESAIVEEAPAALNTLVEEQVGADEGSPDVAAAGPGCVEAGGGAEEWHAARTHCTWPLERRDHLDEFVLEEDVQVEQLEQLEQLEGSESNIYTIRSDLFLHGNVLINEDSEHMSAVLPARDLDLGLDVPAGDLLAEELMYTDAAEEESSFRVFLMNSEELA